MYKFMSIYFTIIHRKIDFCNLFEWKFEKKPHFEKQAFLPLSNFSLEVKKRIRILEMVCQ